MFVVIKSSFMRALFGKSEEVLTYDGKLLNFNTKEEAQKIREGLLEYCKLDTFAMVKIWERFKDIIGEEL